MKRALKAYPTLLKIGIAEAVAYRAEFVVWMFTMTLPLVMLAVWSAVARESPIGRFDGPAFVAYYLATLLVRQLTGSWVVWELNREIREGTLALRLLRPIHPLWAHSAEGLASIPLRAVIAAPIAFVALFVAGHGHVTHDPLIIAAFVLSLLGAWLLNFGVSAMIGTLGLFLESSLAVWQLWMGAFAVLSGYLVPLSLFPRWVERIARLLPFAYLQALPVELITGVKTRQAALAGLAGQWSYALGALLCMSLLWRTAVKRFAAYGG
jgi:ABC-2 type transport system permease protein